ncbi:MAG TPA: hypothetical protein VHS96_01605, partial [Bacteroidia bacterium]|nr:hypothetical protein [Bacteroidia bacterium]
MARTLFFALLLILSAVSLPAQFVLNGGFEDTTITSNDTVPRHWSVDPIGTALTNDAHSGNQAIQLWNWYYYGRAWIAYGNTTNSFSGGGMPVSFNP